MTSVFRHIYGLWKCLPYVNMPYYAVKLGRNPGVYNTWPECEKQVKGLHKARYKKFPTEEAAWEFIKEKDPWETPKKSVSTTQKSTAISPTSPSNVVRNLYHNTASSPYTNSSATSCTGPVSTSQMLALKGTLRNIAQTIDQLRQFTTQAEQQLAALQNSSKRLLEPSGGDLSSPPAKFARTVSDIAGNGLSIPSRSGPVSVYTDGCCHNNGRGNPKAGIGVYWGDGDPRNVAEHLPGRPTNNRAEIHAAIRAIQQAKLQNISELVLHTDSEFLINSITKWIHKWKTNGWKLSTGNPVINREDFEKLDEVLDSSINVTWVHVRGHQGIYGNEQADKLANDGARK